ncbi:MAG: DUF1080 domain-containing protein [Gammaproteobacteria bacterium]|nr:DUF1080 domain-containing protein [Gammaproteobacteria bacterium]
MRTTTHSIGRLRRPVLGSILLALLGACGGGEPQPDGEGRLTLFNGTDLSNWSVLGEGSWRVEDGTITADGSGADASFLVSDASFADFELELEFWVDTEANSGVFIRCGDPESVDEASCYEINIFDTRPDQTYRTGAIMNVAEPSEFVYTGGQWNRYEIAADGNRLQVTLNGRDMVDVEDSRLSAGPIALQHGSGTVRFRNVRIREL